MNCGHGVNDRFACTATSINAEKSFGCFAFADDESINERHDIERSTIDIEIVAIANGGGNRNCSAVEGGDDAMFATHVMSTGEHVAKWWTTQDKLLSVASCDLEGEIGVAASDHIKCEWTHGASNVGFEPGGDFADIETGVAGRFTTHAPVRYLRTNDLVCP